MLVKIEFRESILDLNGVKEVMTNDNYVIVYFHNDEQSWFPHRDITAIHISKSAK